MTRLLPIAPAVLILATAAVAAEPQPVTSASAAWVAEGKVQLDVAWQGGACERPSEPEVTSADDGTTLQVTIPTVSTAEVCTMQIVEVTYSGIIPVEPMTATLAITVLDPEGRPSATGTAEIEAANAPS